MLTGLKFRTKEGSPKEEEGLYYLCSENKDADQMHCYHATDLCLYFRMCKKPVFS